MTDDPVLLDDWHPVAAASDAHSVRAERSGHDDDAVRAFEHLIFEQDRPIVESQRPKKLPLAPRAEMPQRADALSVPYRRFLRGCGLRFGVSDEVPARGSSLP